MRQSFEVTSTIGLDVVHLGWDEGDGRSSIIVARVHREIMQGKGGSSSPAGKQAYLRRPIVK